MNDKAEYILAAMKDELSRAGTWDEDLRMHLPERSVMLQVRGETSRIRIPLVQDDEIGTFGLTATDGCWVAELANEELIALALERLF